MLDKNKSLNGGCGCGQPDCGCGTRNRFFRGKRMRADDFAIEQRYTIEQRRLVNRTVVGSGVVAGFEMAAGSSDVGPGFALDDHGREIVLTHKASLGLKNLFLIEPGASGCRTLSIEHATPRKKYLLSIHYAERSFGDAHLPERCGCEKPEKNYVCETGVFSLTELATPCPCGDEPCGEPCDCGASDACDRPQRETPAQNYVEARQEEPRDAEDPQRRLAEARQRLRSGGELPPPEPRQQAGGAPVDSHTSRTRGPHACVCHNRMKHTITCDQATLCRWNEYLIDPAHGVALACVTVRKTGDECRPIEIEVVDPCGPRRFVKTNDFLYDLLRGCDLTRISGVSWHAWHRRRELMPWPVFASMFDPADGWTAFAVRFSTPVLIDTIRYDSVVMRVITIEQPTDWRLMHRIPIVRVEPEPTKKMPDDRTTDQIRIYVSTHWIADEIAGRSTWLTRDGFAVEIDILGDGILNCHRLPVDGDAIGVDATPSGNGTPGGTYRSSFRVEAKPHKPENA